MLPLQTRCRPSIDSLSAVVGNQSSQKADVFFFFQREIGLGLKSLFSSEKVVKISLFQREEVVFLAGICFRERGCCGGGGGGDREERRRR